MTSARGFRCRRDVSHGDSGAILVLALVFLLIGGLVLVPLVSLARTNLVTTSDLQSQRSNEYSADGAMEGAIETLRHEAPGSLTNPTCPNFPSGAGTSVAVDGDPIVVECTMAIPQVPQPYYGRIVEFDACGIADATSFSSCQAAVLIRADVIFNDVSSAAGCSSGANPGCYGSS
ncbi:MAG TPA: hypothetical protein VKR22_01475, partial [Acidimicrobiales bacterium]|nr:hypothetical protein [Acidimicrobiales bacterium]